MKTMKKHVMYALCLGFAVAAIGGAASVRTSAESSLSALTTDNYKVEQASIRYTKEDDEKSGIRFRLTMAKEAYDSITAIDGAELGALLLPSDLAEDGLTLETSTATKAITYSASGENAWSASEGNADVMEAIVYMYDIDCVSYNREISVVGYAQAGSDSFYTTSVSESVSEVALKLLTADEAESKLSDTQKTELNGFLNTYDVKFYDTDGTTLLFSSSVKYGSSVTVPTTTDGKNIVGWYAYDGENYASTATTLASSLTVKSNLQYKVSEKYDSLFEAIEHTETKVTKEKVYGTQTYSTAVKSGAYQTIIFFKLGEKAPAAPSDATHVTIYYLGDTNVQNYANMYRLTAFGTEMTAYASDWTAIKVTKAVYEDYRTKGTSFTMVDNSGANAGKYVYFSQPIFTTETSFYEAVSNTTVTKVTTEKSYTAGDLTFANFYGTQKAVYTATYNGDNAYNSESAAKFKLSSAAIADIPENTKTVQIAVRQTNQCWNFPKLSDGTTEITQHCNEWRYFTYTVGEFKELVQNNTTFSFGDTNGGGKLGLLLISEPIFKSEYNPFTASNGTFAFDYENVYENEDYSLKYQPSAWMGVFTLNELAPVAPEGTTKVTFYVKTTGAASESNTKHSFGAGDQTQHSGTQLTKDVWVKIEMSVSDYNSYKTQSTKLHFTNGNNVGSYTYWISNFIFS